MDGVVFVTALFLMAAPLLRMDLVIGIIIDNMV
jgi:hypothetical protein